MAETPWRHQLQERGFDNLPQRPWRIGKRELDILRLRQAAEAANRRLLALFKKGWKKDEGLLFHCYREYKKRLCYHHKAEA